MRVELFEMGSEDAALKPLWVFRRGWLDAAASKLNECDDSNEDGWLALQ